MTEYGRAEQYIESLTHRTGKHSIREVQQYLGSLGSPDLVGYRLVHVAGTDGKGSTVCYLSSVLSAMGYHVGIFTSPHLVSLRERMQIDGAMISREEFAAAFDRVREVVPALQGEDGINAGHPSYFEFLFLMAMVWFAEKRPDIVILEAGMGGLSDATNAVRHTDLSVITRIGMDHMQYLGNTIEEIAAQKAGIIRHGTPVVCLADPVAAAEVITRKADAEEAPCFVLRREDYTGRLSFSTLCGRAAAGECEETPSAAHNEALRTEGAECVDFSYRSHYDDIVHVCAQLATSALYQSENAALACLALEVMEERKILQEPEADQSVQAREAEDGIRSAAGREHLVQKGAENSVWQDDRPGCSDIRARLVQKGLERAVWPGRMQEIRPHFFVDGAHNEDALRALVDTVRARKSRTDAGAGEKTCLLFSCVRDKAYEKELAMLCTSGAFDQIMLCPMPAAGTAGRAAGYEELLAAARKIEEDLPEDERAKDSVFTSCPDAGAAVQEAMCLIQRGYEVYAAGSLYFAGMILQLAG